MCTLILYITRHLTTSWFKILIVIQSGAVFEYMYFNHQIDTVVNLLKLGYEMQFPKEQSDHHHTFNHCVFLADFPIVSQKWDSLIWYYAYKVYSAIGIDPFRLTRQYCCERFREEYQSECIRHDTEVFKYSGERKGVYYLMFERNFARAFGILSILW